LVVGEGVLLPVDEVPARFDLLRIREHLGAAVRCWAQADHLWAEFDEAVVPIMRDVAQSNMNGISSAVYQEDNHGYEIGSAGYRVAVRLASMLASLAPNGDDNRSGCMSGKGFEP